tara:strand:+ start:1339 stop:1605 length:267 start_codon:yes stop_codon:yes gene_type:complete
MSKDFDNWWNADSLVEDNPFRRESPAFWAWEGWHAGVVAGKKQERALWELTKIGQEIEEDEYCPHGIRHERHCKSCECIEQADMRSEM